MKLPLTILFFSGLLQISLALKDYKVESDWCIERYDLNSSEIYRIHSGAHLPQDSKPYSTFMECLWRKIQFLDGDGELNLAKIREYYRVAQEGHDEVESARRADAVVERCRHAGGSTPAIRAINMGNCLKNN
uniref:Uncharacterized protein n=1 Tax=Photinus pyralis TaxID=7054 RepID=A0A1Y1NAM6_PHOPY